MMLAPNGKPSNLTPEQYRIVRTPAFKAWFGDWENDAENSSKVIDENGEPLICFHGSNNEFNVFEEKYLGSSNDMGFYGRGFYFTFQKDEKYMKFAIDEAGYYGKVIKSYFIKALNPFIFGELKKYKGVNISLYGTQSLVFLNNIAKTFPKLAEIITLNKTVYNSFNKEENEVIQVPISVLPDLIDKYSKDLKIIEVEDRGEIKINGYLKSKTKEVFYDSTESGGTKGSYLDFETLSYGIDSRNKKEEIEILLIEAALEKYDGIEVKYNPEGYMTRYPEITEEIKKNHDCIMQGETGDELVVFENNRIKLADGTNTTFDSNNPDIRFYDGGEIGDKKSSDEIIDYVYEIHRDKDDFEDDEDFIGLATMIRKYDSYILKEIDINNIKERGKRYDEERVNKIINEINENPSYPPIILDEDFIIDGVHRFVALKRLGHKKIKAFVDSNPDIRYKNGGLTMKALKLLAPNGKPSNLSSEQYRLVRTPAFKKWFGDWETDAKNSSKVVDQNGEPLVVWHGSNKNFNKFQLNKANKNFESFWFTKDKDIIERGESGAESTKYIRPFFLNIKTMAGYNEYEKYNYLDSRIVSAKKLNEFKAKFDGISLDDEPPYYIVFNSNQIKLADGTNTTFDANNPDIRFDEGGTTMRKPKVKLIKLYRGTNTEEHDSRKLTWFSTNKDFAKGYGDILIEKDIYVGKVFDSTNPNQVQLLIDNGFQLYNEYDDTYFKTAEEASNYSDTWDFIENSYGVLDWIDSKGYDSVKILEGGSNVNYILINYNEGSNPDIRFDDGGSIPDLLSIEQIENKLGRELHWWNDDIVYLSGVKYKKVYLRPEYKRVIE